ncbi:hypothetical protein [Vibrio gallicus]|uniref:hypothetical protein n=1 Tax=Vibrio gallicus TaxID=190897 RepID=UPI0021C3EB48|nr:hypothetical protein [Vibrio gallicus]
MRIISCAITLLLLIGCADHAVQDRGAEAIAYQEQHRFELSFESDDKRLETERIAAIVNQFDLSQARFDVYVPQSMQAQGKQLLSYLKQDLRLRPDWVTSHSLEQGEGITLQVSQWRSVIEKCQPLTISKPQPQAGCAVQTNNTIQLVNPGGRVN